MDANTLVDAMPNLSLQRAEALLADCNAAMELAGCTTVNRAAMFLAQVGHESGSLTFTQETAPAVHAAYKPYIGRTFIQVTWKGNYAKFGAWCVQNKIHDLTDPDAFVKDPESLADDLWAWYGAVWYWTTTLDRHGYHDLNAAADARDITAATEIVNGGTIGLDDRKQRWQHCLDLGTAILPTDQAPNAFPLPSTDYYGLSGRQPSHNGFHAADQAPIKRCQKALGLHQTGQFGPVTRSTLISWQRQHGLAPTGRIGPKTWAELAKQEGF